MPRMIVYNQSMPWIARYITVLQSLSVKMDRDILQAYKTIIEAK